MRQMWFPRWLAFVLYTVFLFATAPALLWGMPGLFCGLAVAALFLGVLRWNGLAQVARKLSALPLTAAQAPVEHCLVREYARRLNLVAPTLMVVEAPGLNIGVFGFNKHATCLVFTRGLLTTLSRTQLASLIARNLCHIWDGEVGNETWLARFLDVLCLFLGTPKTKRTPPRSHSIPLRLMLRQLAVYPLTLFPSFVLKGARDGTSLDLRAIQICQDPQALTEAYRRLEARAERIPYHPPFSMRHFFLGSPLSPDPLTRIFFHSPGISGRAKTIESLRQTAVHTV